jgi:hypothetical protein
MRNSASVVRAISHLYPKHRGEKGVWCLNVKKRVREKEKRREKSIAIQQGNLFILSDSAK